MSILLGKARAALLLGLPNLWRVLAYRVGVRLGINPVRRIRARIPDGDCFTRTRPLPLMTDGANQDGWLHPSLPPPTRRWWNRQDYFGWFQIDDSAIPHWHRNPLTGAEVPRPHRPWWQIADFDEQLGDIKTVWEASRFDWVLTFAQHACHGDPLAMERLNAWLADWLQGNPPYRGPNWKCGQEASIRVMHLASAALLLDQVQQPTPVLRALVAAHLQRIAPTIQYAIAQDNNHGTSEAAALFIGGSWLAASGEPTGVRWARQGRRWLENRARRLIEEDGSFSQYSVNYHRLMLDTYSLAEQWRRRLGLPAFSPFLYRRLRAAARWLYQMTQVETGAVPNLGANDGANLLPLGRTDVRDFRPSVQLAMALFDARCAYPVMAPSGSDVNSTGEAARTDVRPTGLGVDTWNQPLTWLGIARPTQAAEPVCSAQFPQGGYSLLRRGRAFALLRFPRFRFRPSQADALHLDLWVAGENLLRDAGSYSYNADEALIRYFSGTASHNTVQFDDRDQMPRLSRFLFGDWLKADQVMPVTETPETVTAAAGYTDGQGAAHHRQVWLSDRLLRVEDRVSGFTDKAVLRWRLAPGDWHLEGDTVVRDGHVLQVTASVAIQSMQLIAGWESCYYLQRTPVPVLEIAIRQPGRFMSAYRFES